MLCLFYYSWRASSYPRHQGWYKQDKRWLIAQPGENDIQRAFSDITWYRRIELLTYPYLTFLTAMTQNECKYSRDVKPQKTIGHWLSVSGNQQVIGSLAKWLSVIGHCWSRGPTTSAHKCYNISAYDSSLFPRPPPDLIRSKKKQLTQFWRTLSLLTSQSIYSFRFRTDVHLKLPPSPDLVPRPRLDSPSRNTHVLFMCISQSESK